MKSAAIFLFTLLFGAPVVFAQTVVSTPSKSSSETLQLQMLTKKIEEQNAKIDILSQQILKLEQRVSHTRPGIMIGEADSSPAKPAASTTPLPRPVGGTTHTVERGETLTSIAKLHGVGIGELQRYNHIEDPLKLRAGQVLVIPPSASPAASPNE